MGAHITRLNETNIYNHFTLIYTVPNTFIPHRYAPTGTVNTTDFEPGIECQYSFHDKNYEGMLTLQVDPEAQVVQPEYPWPPHWPHFWTVHPPGVPGLEVG